jgi:hypothetical protein
VAVVPAGDLMFSADATLEDDDKLDPVIPEARKRWCRICRMRASDI